MLPIQHAINTSYNSSVVGYKCRQITPADYILYAFAAICSGMKKYTGILDLRSIEM